MMQRSEEHRLTPPVGNRDHAQGHANAPVKLVMFGDYECPYTRRVRPVVRRLRRELGDRLLYAFRNFPLTRIYPHAQQAAEAAEVAAGQDKFWEMHIVLFENQRMLQYTDLVRYAEQVGLDQVRFEEEMEGHAYTGRVEEDVRSGIKSRVRQTPTFFVNGVRHDGANDLPTLLATIEEAGSLREGRSA